MARRDYHMLLVFLMQHLVYAVVGMVGGCTFCLLAYFDMLTDGDVKFSPVGVIALSSGFYCLAAGFYASSTIEWAYVKYVLPQVRALEPDDDQNG
jgi:di/tricarboxylate transporter